MQIRVDAFGKFFDDLSDLHEELVAAKNLAEEVRELVAIVFGGPSGRVLPREKVEELSKFRGWLFEAYRLPLRRRLLPSNWGKLLCVPNGRAPVVVPFQGPKVIDLLCTLKKARVFSAEGRGAVFTTKCDIPDIEVTRMVLRRDVEDLEAAKAFLYPHSFKEM